MFNLILDVNLNHPSLKKYNVFSSIKLKCEKISKIHQFEFIVKYYKCKNWIKSCNSITNTEIYIKLNKKDSMYVKIWFECILIISCELYYNHTVTRLSSVKIWPFEHVISEKEVAYFL